MPDSAAFPELRTPAALSHSRRLIYAIGDIHGRLDLFEAMLDKVREDAAASGERPLLILLGDYIDRGPASFDVVERILALETEDWCDLELLMGNHEWALLRFLHQSESGVSWLDHGAAATLASYGVGLPGKRLDPTGYAEARDRFQAAVPKSHLHLLMRLQLYTVHDDYLFVHAGVRPDVPLAEQTARDFLWIRTAFLTSPRANDHVVVHGHTPETQPVNLRWRIGLDTGAYATGVLTAVRLHGSDRRILQSQASNRQASIGPRNQPGKVPACSPAG